MCNNVKKADVKMQQYNTVGRDRKGSVTSVHGVANWFSSLRRTPKKNKGQSKGNLSSRSDWDLSISTTKRNITLTTTVCQKKKKNQFTYLILMRIKYCEINYLH